jgi:hypothetical protein
MGINSIHPGHPSFQHVNYVIANRSSHSYFITLSLRKHLDELLEGTVDGRAKGLDVLVEVDGSLGALSNTLGGELELLLWVLACGF